MASARDLDAPAAGEVVVAVIEFNRYPSEWVVVVIVELNFDKVLGNPLVVDRENLVRKYVALAEDGRALDPCGSNIKSCYNKWF